MASALVSFQAATTRHALKHFATEPYCNGIAGYALLVYLVHHGVPSHPSSLAALDE